MNQVDARKNDAFARHDQSYYVANYNKFELNFTKKRLGVTLQLTCFRAVGVSNRIEALQHHTHASSGQLYSDQVICSQSNNLCINI